MTRVFGRIASGRGDQRRRIVRSAMRRLSPDVWRFFHLFAPGTEARTGPDAGASDPSQLSAETFRRCGLLSAGMAQA